MSGKSLQINPSETGSNSLIVQNNEMSDINAIAYFFSNDQLKGDDIYTQCQVLQWMFTSQDQIYHNVHGWVLSTLKSNQSCPKDSVKAHKNSVIQVLDSLNKILSSRTFLVGERITLADISVFSALLGAYKHVLDPTICKTYQNTTRWFQTIRNQKDVKEIVGDFTCYKKE